MASGDTSRETPSSGAFPATRWSLLLDGASQPKKRRELWESLATTYWKPVYGYVRARWAKTQDDALDLTQEFFLWMLESGLVHRADPERGRFRAFVKTSLANFLTDLERKRGAQKRGGDRAALSLHGDDAEPVPELPDTTGRTPDEVLDELWRTELLERAVAALREELEQSGKRTYFDVFRLYFLDDEKLDYAAVAARFDLTTTDVSNYLSYVKRRYRLQLERAVLETVGDRSELEAEVAWLLEGRSS